MMCVCTYVLGSRKCLQHTLQLLPNSLCLPCSVPDFCESSDEELLHVCPLVQELLGKELDVVGLLGLQLGIASQDGHLTPGGGEGRGGEEEREEGEREGRGGEGRGEEGRVSATVCKDTYVRKSVCSLN